jgi:shikimate kinase
MGVPRRNIVLTGFMGSGKTTVGRVLAYRLGYEFVDTDALIEAEHGPIPQIFAEFGEGRFRQLERDAARALADREGLVVSTGGRMMVDPANAETLGATGDVVALTATVDTIVERVGGDAAAATRPMLAGHDVRERITQLLAERAPAYARFVQIATDGRTLDEVADAVLAARAG